MSGALGALVVYAVAMSLTPGPYTPMALPPDMESGLRRSGWHLLGLLWGTYLMICLVGVVLGGVFMAAPGVQPVLRLAAGFCMLWLAVRLWRGGVSPRARARGPLRFGEAVLIQLGHPMAWLAATGVIVGFVPAGALYLERVLAMAGVFCLACLPGMTRWAAAVSAQASRSHARQPWRQGAALLVIATAALFAT